MTQAEQRDINRKLRILNYAQEKESGNISKTCRYFGICRETYYKWKRAYEKHGEHALINSKPCPENPKLRTPAHIEEKILYLRRTYHLGQLPITWYLQHYHGIKISSGAVYYVLKRNGLNRLPQTVKRSARAKPWQRYEKRVPGHHVQIDVKFLNFEDQSGKKVRREGLHTVQDQTKKCKLRPNNEKV